MAKVLGDLHIARDLEVVRDSRVGGNQVVEKDQTVNGQSLVMRPTFQGFAVGRTFWPDLTLNSTDKRQSVTPDWVLDLIKENVLYRDLSTGDIFMGDSVLYHGDGRGTEGSYRPPISFLGASDSGVKPDGNGGMYFITDGKARLHIKQNGEVEVLGDFLDAELEAHMAQSNPHGLVKADLGLSLLQNKGIGHTVDFNASATTLESKYASLAAVKHAIENTLHSRVVDINMSDHELIWGGATDWMKMGFKYTTDAAINYGYIEMGDNGNEEFRFTHRSGATTTTRLTINGNGISAANFHVSSDVRIKSNKQDILDPFKIINEIDTFYADIKQPDGSIKERQPTFIAQQVRAVIPQITDVSEWNGIDDFHFINYTAMIPLHHKGLQVLYGEVMEQNRVLKKLLDKQ